MDDWRENFRLSFFYLLYHCQYMVPRIEKVIVGCGVRYVRSSAREPNTYIRNSGKASTQIFFWKNSRKGRVNKVQNLINEEAFITSVLP